MKIAVSATGNTMESVLDQRFGRAAWFVLVETETMEYEAVDNAATASSGGAGISAAQTVANKDAKAVITGNVGPNAMNVLNAANLKIYKGIVASVKENVEMLKKGELKRISAAAPTHYGMR